ncbi:hypothetical protein UA75_20270 [Actinoalloteichus sp. GBA129-24]|uniref:Uncharacterized protein n=1 Tax=Actinoalloteichus fjordicus TaxID=1612552 RepID=A0AAC9PSV6_9PSEU|nr:hypothetical protein UA74_19770 [Actinoalloteichus fjordicus]APU22043.1 hypothetical protein UA75_20270 [Actinoalloteichus sp. GBA129-24]
MSYRHQVPRPDLDDREPDPAHGSAAAPGRLPIPQHAGRDRPDAERSIDVPMR